MKFSKKKRRTKLTFFDVASTTRQRKMKKLTTPKSVDYFPAQEKRIFSMQIFEQKNKISQNVFNINFI